MKVGSLSQLAYFKIKVHNFMWKVEGVYGQNMYDMMMLVGYAIKYETVADNLLRDEKQYTTLDAFSVWTDFGFTVKKFQFGLFGGYTQNLGSLHNISSWTSATSYYSRGYDIHHIYRVSPRIVFTTGKFRAALEGEYTTAAYGSKINSLGLVDELKPVSNIRVLLGVYYSF